MLGESKLCEYFPEWEEQEDHEGEEHCGQGQGQADSSFSQGYLRLGLVGLLTGTATFIISSDTKITQNFITQNK